MGLGSHPPPTQPFPGHLGLIPLGELLAEHRQLRPRVLECQGGASLAFSSQVGLWHCLPSQCSPLVLRGEKLAELAGRVSMALHGSLVPVLHLLGSLNCGVTQASEKQGLPMASAGPGPAGQEGPIKAERGRLRGEAHSIVPKLCGGLCQGSPAGAASPRPPPILLLEAVVYKGAEERKQSWCSLAKGGAVASEPSAPTWGSY